MIYGPILFYGHQLYLESDSIQNAEQKIIKESGLTYSEFLNALSLKKLSHETFRIKTVIEKYSSK